MSITKTLIDPAVSYIDSKWMSSTNISEKFYARGANLLLAPATLITHTFDTILGLGVILGVFCTLGRHAVVADHAAILTNHSIQIFSAPYMQLLKTIDPKQKSLAKRDSQNYNADMGLLTEKMAFIFKYASNISKSPNFFSRHIVSRLCFVMLAVASVITRWLMESLVFWLQVYHY